MDAIRYFATFADDGEWLFTTVADSMPMTVVDVLSANPTAIEISEHQQRQLMAGYRYVAGALIAPTPDEEVIEEIVPTVAEARNLRIAEVNTEARRLLSETDPRVIEQLETGMLPTNEWANLKTERQYIRNVRDQAIEELYNANTLEEIAAVVVNFEV